MSRWLIINLYAAGFREQLGETRSEELFTLPQPWLRPDIAVTRLICDTYLRENGIAQSAIG